MSRVRLGEGAWVWLDNESVMGRSVTQLGTVGPWRPCSDHGLAVWMDMTRTAVVLSLGWHWGGTGGGTVGGDGAKESEGWDGLSR